MLLFSTVHKDPRGQPYRMFDKKAGDNYRSLHKRHISIQKNPQLPG